MVMERKTLTIFYLVFVEIMSIMLRIIISNICMVLEMFTRRRNLFCMCVYIYVYIFCEGIRQETRVKISAFTLKLFALLFRV